MRKFLLELLLHRGICSVDDLMSFWPKSNDEMMLHTGLIILVFVFKNRPSGRVSSFAQYSSLAGLQPDFA